MTHVYIIDSVVNVEKLEPQHVDIEDIARTLSRINRYSGRTRYPYSVAQHAVLVSRLVPPHLAYEALHHDDTEAYIGDVINPIKDDTIREKEARVRAGLVPVLGLLPKEPQAVKLADLAALGIEQTLLQGRLGCLPTLPYGDIGGLADAIKAVRQMHYRKAEELYLERHYLLSGNLAS